MISRLRRILASAPGGAGATIGRRAGVYELVLPPGSVVDVVEARVALDRARGDVAAGRLDEAVAAAREAAEVARRPLVPGTSSCWLDDQRDVLRALLVEALAVEVEVAIRRHDPAGLAAADEAIATDPLADRSYVNRTRLELALDEKAAALETYARYAAAVVDELGTPPSREMEALAAAARGESRVVVSTDRPQTWPATTVPVGALPVATASFVGRDSALAEIGRGFERSRLITITGAAGVGKSRLAVEAAHRLGARHADGVRACELAHVAHPAGVVPAVAVAVGVASRTGLAVDEGIVDALASRRMLLVVDNCEHVLPSIAPLVERILGYCPHVHVLATSRERLAAEGETLVALEPLELPDPEHDPAEAWSRPAPALALLRDRILAVRPGFAPRAEERAALVEICCRLDGLPLAIELAAARMATMGPLDVAQRLDRRLAVLTSGRRTAPARHRTLRAAIEWSYDLLDDAEREVFERASVFVGGFTLAAADQVLAGAGQPERTSELIGALVDKSLLILDARRPATRYGMLDTLREFACERISDRGETDEAACAHAEYFVRLAREAEPHVRGPDEAAWVAALELELPNLRAAHEWARRAGRHDLACDLSAALVWFAFWRMHAEVFSWADRIVEAPDAADADRYAEAVAAAARGAMVQGELEWAEILARRAIAAAGDDPSARYGWHLLGDVGLFSGDLDRGHDALERAEQLARTADDSYHCGLLQGCRALTRLYSGDPASAERILASDSHDVLAASPTLEAWTNYVAGEVLITSEPHRALARFERASAAAKAVSNEFICGVADLSATTIRARHEDPADAAPAVVDVIDRWERGGNWRQQWVTMRSVTELLMRLGRYEAAAVLLGAIERGDSENVFGEDAERLGRARGDLVRHLGPALDDHLAEGHRLDRPDLVAFVRAELLAAAGTRSRGEGATA